MIDAVTLDTKIRRKKNIIALIVILSIVIACAIHIAIFLTQKKFDDDMIILIITLIGTFAFMLSTILLTYFIALNNYMKVIGPESKAEFSHDGIKLYDVLNDHEIKKVYKWADIKSVTVQLYRAGFMKKTYCVKFTTHKEDVLFKLSRREKRHLPMLQKRELALDHEFYIDGSYDELMGYLSYWDGPIKSQSLYFNQMQDKKPLENTKA